MSSTDDSSPAEPALEVQEAEWSALKYHLERGGLITVSQDLDLRVVAVHASEDDKQTVSAWIEKGLLAKPTEEQIQFWDESPEREFRFVIVQPFVLIQIKAQ